MASLQAPTDVGLLGIPESMVEEVFLQRVFVERTSTLLEMGRHLGTTIPLITAVAETLREKQLVEFLGMEGRDYRVGLTSKGYEQARAKSEQRNYAGVLPIGLDDYVALVLRQKAEPRLDRETVRAAFSDLVVPDRVLDQLGPAFLNDGAVFLYGPPGTGKTALAERMIRVHHDGVYVPRAVSTSGAIITVFDPTIHTALPDQPAGLDPRLVACSRPTVVVGGELSMNMLDLDLDKNSGVYQAPLQMMANNGILVVDDFGRQQVSPSELLNRWIVPLSRGVDYLRLATGGKFQVPFEVKLVASTNLDPNSLGDDAFLRRLRNKVFVGPVEEEAFDRILHGVAHARKIALTPDSAGYLRRVAHHHLGDLRPYLAVDFCDLVVGICKYEGVPLSLSADMIARVADVYFVTEDEDEIAVPLRSSRPEPPAEVPDESAAIGEAPEVAPTPQQLPDQVTDESSPAELIGEVAPATNAEAPAFAVDPRPQDPLPAPPAAGTQRAPFAMGPSASEVAPAADGSVVPDASLPSPPLATKPAPPT